MRRTVVWFGLYTSEQDEPHYVGDSRDDVAHTKRDWDMADGVIRRVTLTWDDDARPAPRRKAGGRAKRA